MSKRPPAKRRGPSRPPRAEQPQPEPIGEAPPHLGGSFDQTGYPDQRWDGYFGFAPKPDWPVDKRSREARA